jgi:hypothetical protein
MKVLKAKVDLGFLYAPSVKAASVEDAVFKIVGKACASNCQWSILDSNGFELQAFLPKVNANPAHISNVGQYLSIDARPVCTSRGTIKKIVTLFKEKLRSYDNRFEGVKDPFLYLNIKCPMASYDQNVEPAKDDVLFDDSSKVITAAEELFSAIYKMHEQENTEPTIAVESSHSMKHISTPRDNIKCPGTSVEEEDPSFPNSLHHAGHEDDFNSIDDDIIFLKRRAEASAAALNENIYGMDEDDLELPADEDTRSSSMESEHPSEVVRDVTVSNPWTIAKMNTRLQPSAYEYPVLSTTGPSQHSTARHKPVQDSTLSSATPAHFSPLKTPLVKSHTTSRAIRGPGLSDLKTPIPLQPPRFEQWQVERLVNGLTTPFPSHHLPSRPQFEQYGLPTPQPSSSPACVISSGTPLNAIPEAPRSKRQFGVRANAYNPTQRLAHGYDWNMPFNASTSSKRRKKAGGSTNDRSRDIRDMIACSIARSAALVVQGEPEEEVSEQTTSLQIINKRLDNVDVEPREVRMQSESHESTIANDIPDEELLASISPTTYSTVKVNSEKAVEAARIVKRRRTTESRRTKSSRLPLERVPDNAQMQDVILRYSTSVRTICCSIGKLDVSSNFTSWYETVETAYNTFPVPSEAEIKEWARKIVGRMQQNCGIDSESDVGGTEDRVANALQSVKWV